jgi:uncharacterized protein
MSLADEQFLAFTTFTRDGTPKVVPVWPVDADDGRIGFITSSESWKVKRLAHTSRVLVQPSDYKGRPTTGSAPRQGTAQVVDGAAFETIHAKVRAKYGFKLTVVHGLRSLGRLVGRGGQSNDRAVIVTLDRLGAASRNGDRRWLHLDRCRR